MYNKEWKKLYKLNRPIHEDKTGAFWSQAKIINLLVE